MSMVHMPVGINPLAPPHLPSEPATMVRLVGAALPESTIPQCWLVENYDRIRERIGAVFDDFTGFSEEARVPDDFHLYNTASEHVWSMPPDKAESHAHVVPTDTPVHRAREHHADVTVLTLVTVRSHDQYNTTIYGIDGRYHGVFSQRRVVFINKENLHTVRMKDDEWVDMVTLSGDGTTYRVDSFRLVVYDIPCGYLAVYYPETNPLMPLSSVADQVHTPTSKSVPVTLVPSQIVHVADTQTATTAET